MIDISIFLYSWWTNILQFTSSQNSRFFRIFLRIRKFKANLKFENYVVKFPKMAFRVNFCTKNSQNLAWKAKEHLTWDSSRFLNPWCGDHNFENIDFDIFSQDFPQMRDFEKHFLKQRHFRVQSCFLNSEPSLAWRKCTKTGQSFKKTVFWWIQHGCTLLKSNLFKAFSSNFKHFKFYCDWYHNFGVVEYWLNSGSKSHIWSLEPSLARRKCTKTGPRFKSGVFVEFNTAVLWKKTSIFQHFPQNSSILNFDVIDISIFRAVEYWLNSGSKSHIWNLEPSLARRKCTKTGLTFKSVVFRWIQHGFTLLKSKLFKAFSSQFEHVEFWCAWFHNFWSCRILIEFLFKSHIWSLEPSLARRKCTKTGQSPKKRVFRKFRWPVLC